MGQPLTRRARGRWPSRPDPGCPGQGGDQFPNGGQGLHQGGGRQQSRFTFGLPARDRSAEADKRLRGQLRRLGWLGPVGGNFGTFSASTSSNYIGTFVVGMYDPGVKKLVWIGAAQHAIEPSKKQEKNQQRLNKGAQKLLKNFPPGRGR